MNLRIEELTLPRYIDRDTSPDIITAFDMYAEVLPKDVAERPPQARRALTIYKFNGSIPYIVRDEDTSGVLAIANFDPACQLKGHSFLEALVVDEPARGQGVGRFVVQELMRITKERGRERLRLRALGDALGFYSRLGFVCDEIVPVEPTEPYMSIDASLDLSELEPAE